VHGIGEVYEQRLYNAGVGSYWELATLSEEQLRDILELSELQMLAVDLPAIQAEARRLAEETGSMTAIRVGIIGATGYSGIELVRILSAHPDVTMTYLSSESYTGQAISEVYPHLAARIGHALDGLDPAVVADRCDAVFLGLPAGKSSEIVPALLARGLRVIDLGGDFRLDDAAVHEQWYKKPAPDRSLQAQAVYGLSELWREAVQQATFITNPGCYPTSAVLAVAMGLWFILRGAGWGIPLVSPTEKSLRVETHHPAAENGGSPRTQPSGPAAPVRSGAESEKPGACCTR
jgi:hypothetical protein